MVAATARLDDLLLFTDADWRFTERKLIVDQDFSQSIINQLPMNQLCTRFTLFFLSCLFGPFLHGQDTTAPWQEDQRVGKRFEVSIESLPEPYTGPQARNSPVTKPRNGAMPQLPAGFSATLYAENLTHPRQVLVLPNGDVLLACQRPGYLMLMRDDDGDGRADWIQRHAAGFNGPYGLAHRDGELLVADQDGIWTIGYDTGLLRPPFAQPRPASEVPPSDRQPGKYMDGQQLITEKGVFGIVQGHANRDLEIGPDGRLYVGVGTAGNIGVEPEPKITIQSFSASGGNQKTVASGMRNPCGLAIHPETGKLWAVVQERDGLGDSLVPDYLTEVVEGGFYGFPYSYLGSHPQPGFADRAPEKVASAIVPDVLFRSHSAAMDVVFYDGDMFPAEYRGDAFVAMKGSWNRSEPLGPRVARVKFENGKPVGWYENFMTGFWNSGDDKAEVWGRPADVATAPDGALFVVDETAGAIWRVTYTGPAD